MGVAGCLSRQKYLLPVKLMLTSQTGVFASHDALQGFISSCTKTSVNNIITFREIDVSTRHSPIFKWRRAESTPSGAAAKRHLVPPGECHGPAP